MQSVMGTHMHGQAKTNMPPQLEVEGIKTFYRCFQVPQDHSFTFFFFVFFFLFQNKMFRDGAK